MLHGMNATSRAKETLLCYCLQSFWVNEKENRLISLGHTTGRYHAPDQTRLTQQYQFTINNAIWNVTTMSWAVHRDGDLLNPPSTPPQCNDRASGIVTTSPTTVKTCCTFPALYRLTSRIAGRKCITTTVAPLVHMYQLVYCSWKIQNTNIFVISSDWNVEKGELMVIFGMVGEGGGGGVKPAEGWGYALHWIFLLCWCLC